MKRCKLESNWCYLKGTAILKVELAAVVAVEGEGRDLGGVDGHGRVGGELEDGRGLLELAGVGGEEGGGERLIEDL